MSIWFLKKNTNPPVGCIKLKFGDLWLEQLVDLAVFYHLWVFNSTLVIDVNMIILNIISLKTGQNSCLKGGEHGILI